MAVLLAVRHPERVASAASFGGTLNSEGNVDALVEMLTTQSVTETFRQLVPEFSVGPYCSRETIEHVPSMINPNPSETVRDVLLGATKTNGVEEVHPVDVPVLVVVGAHDLTCLPDQSVLMASRLGVTPNVIPAIGHLPMLEASDATLKLLRPHLALADASHD